MHYFNDSRAYSDLKWKPPGMAAKRAFYHIGDGGGVSKRVAKIFFMQIAYTE